MATNHSTTTINSNKDSAHAGYCLKWKYHPNNLLHMFNQLLLNEMYTDVMIGCEGKFIKCHRIILSSCSKYFEQAFSEYPIQQQQTLVILKDMKFTDIQAIIEFMYQGEINVAHDQLPSLLKSAESLQVKGLADITGTGNGKNTSGDDHFDDGMDDEFDGGQSQSALNMMIQEDEQQTGGKDGVVIGKRKRGRPPSLDPILTNNISPPAPTASSSSTHLAPLSQLQAPSQPGSEYDDFTITTLLDSHFIQQRKKPKRATSDDDGDDVGMATGTGEEDDEVTIEEIANIVKMQDYIEKGGSRPQFWDEPTTKKIMCAIRSKKMEMKQAAEILGVSYSTLYSRYRELHGYLKMPHTQDTNFNYYQVLNLLRAGQISLPDAAKRLSIQEKTLGTYLSTSIIPKRPGTSRGNEIEGGEDEDQDDMDDDEDDEQVYPMALLGSTSSDAALNLKQERPDSDTDEIKLPTNILEDIDKDADEWR